MNPLEKNRGKPLKKETAPNPRQLEKNNIREDGPVAPNPVALEILSDKTPAKSGPEKTKNTTSQVNPDGIYQNGLPPEYHREKLEADRYFKIECDNNAKANKIEQDLRAGRIPKADISRKKAEMDTCRQRARNARAKINRCQSNMRRILLEDR